MCLIQAFHSVSIQIPFCNELGHYPPNMHTTFTCLILEQSYLLLVSSQCLPYQVISLKLYTKRAKIAKLSISVKPDLLWNKSVIKMKWVFYGPCIIFALFPGKVVILSIRFYLSIASFYLLRTLLAKQWCDWDVEVGLFNACNIKKTSLHFYIYWT